jgi:hypothetical protein
MAPRTGATLDRGRRAQGEPESLERVTINLTKRSSRALERAAELTNLNKTDSLNRAIQLYTYLEEIIEAGGDIYLRPRPEGDLELLRLF